MDDDLHCKITDFGLAKTKEHTKTQTYTNIIGTIPWTAPEYLTAKRIKERNEKGDVFSFGVIAWELVTREVPWESSGMSSDDIREVVVSGERLEIPSNCEKKIEQLIKECWKDGLDCFHILY